MDNSNGNSYKGISTDIYNPRDVYEVKILLAYFLNRIDRPVTPAQMLEIIRSDDCVSYFLYVEAVEQMKNNGTLALVEREGTEYYVLTDAGREGAESLKDLVSKSVRDRIYASGLKLFAKLRAEREMKFEITPQGTGYSVRCFLEEGSVTLLDLRLFAPDREQADFIKSKILMNPSEFYSRVLDYVIANEEYVPDLNE
ncbi:protein of unknown function [Ruminococcaceae bacterium FB2012]|nr:protein of unknown function [Ruminococcaceae bacterium FB2012]